VFSRTLKHIATLRIPKPVHKGRTRCSNLGTIFARLRFNLGSMASHPIPHSPNAEVTAADLFNRKP
jgi:hypothetical protein